MGIVDRVVRRVVPKTRRGKWRVVVYGLPVVLLACDMGLARLWRRVPVGPETTRVTVVNGKGYPDYLGWINDKYGAGVTPENNAAVALMEVTGYVGDPALLRAMGWEGAVPRGVMGPRYGSFALERIKGRASDEQVRGVYEEADAMVRAPWKAEAHPAWRQWVDGNEEALALLHQAVRRPRYFVPAMGPGGVLRGGGPGAFTEAVWGGPRLESYGKWQGLVEAAMARAQARAGDGDWAGFRADVEDALMLAKRLGSGWHWLDMDGGWAVERRVYAGVLAVVPTIPAGEAGPLLEVLERIGPAGDWARSLDDVYRFADLDLVQMIAREGYRANMPGRAEEMVALVGDPRLGPVARALWPVHYARYAEEVNRWYDGAAAEARGGAGARDDFWEVDVQRGPWWQWSRRAMREVLRLYPAQRWNPRGYVQGLARTGLALRAFKERHGTYPAGLGELAPEVLKEVPKDPWSGAAYRYRREGEGFVLYSVGMDFVDDGGRQRGEREVKGDEVVRVRD
jgi:hypothetical protein